MKFRTPTKLENRALSVLKSFGIEEPTGEQWSEALRVAKNLIAQKARLMPRAKEHVGAYGVSKQDAIPYRPLLQCGAQSIDSGESKAKPDALMVWLLEQRAKL